MSYSSFPPMVSAISYVHKLEAVVDPTKSFKFQQLLASLRRSAKSGDSRQPMTHNILLLILDQLSTAVSSVYECTLFRAMFLFAFHFGLRLGEITDSPHNLLRDSISISATRLEVTFSSFKHAVGPPVTHGVETSFSRLCPVAAMSAYLAFRGVKPGPLFALGGGAVKRHVFSRILRSLLVKCGLKMRITSHSFRIGAATWWAHLKYSEAQIKRLGRWRSNAFLKYLRGPVVHPSS